MKDEKINNRPNIPESWKTETCCANCGSKNDLEWHHIVPLSKGGNNIRSNIVCLCHECHNIVHGRKGTGINHSELTKIGMETARLNGKQIGQVAGKKLHTKKSDIVKEVILKHSKDFGGSLSDTDCIKLAQVARNTYYKYKAELNGEKNK